MEKTRGQKASSKRDLAIIVAGLGTVGMLVFRLVLGKLIGDKGLAYFGVANEIFFVIAGAVAYGLSEAVSSLVRYRIRRGQYRNAQKVLGSAVITGCVFGAALGGGILLEAQMIAGGIFHVPLAGMAVGMMAPAIFFFVLTGVFRGYFQGNGSRMPVMHSQILQVIFLFAGGLIGTIPFRNYGAKVSALLQNEDYTSAYGAMGACVGIFCASVLCFLHVLIIYFLFRHSMRSQTGKELAKNTDSLFRTLHIVLGTGGIYALYWLCSNGWILADAMVLFRTGGEDAAALVGQWGAYYGKVMAFVGVVSSIAGIICLLPVRRIVVLWERNEDRLGREKLGLLVHQCAVVAIPAAVFLAVLAENLLNVFYGGDNRQTAGWLQAGCVTLVFLVFSTVFTEILLKSKNLLYVVAINFSAFLLQLGVLFLVSRAGMGVMGVVVSSIIYYLVISGCGFWLVMRRFRYRQEWVRTFAVTAIAAAVAGVAAMLLNRGLGAVAGSLVSMLISLTAAVIVYLVLLTVLHAFRDDEIKEIAGGFIFRELARLLHIG